MVGNGHTPGPYGVFADDRSIVIRTSDGITPVARMYAAHGADLDNAHLFAAAPDLLEALRAMLNQHDDYFGADRPNVASRVARAAIAKATGQ